MWYKIEGNALKAIADAIRAKTGNTDKMTPSDMPEAISLISGGDSECFYEINKTITEPTKTILLDIDFEPSVIIIMTKNTPDYSEKRAFLAL